MDGSYDHVRDTIHSTLREHSIEPVSIAQRVRSGAVWANDITQAIQEADLIVVDVSQKNPNVLYELGFAHGLRKPTLLLQRVDAGSEIPVDLAGYQIVFYDPKDLTSLRRRILRFLDYQQSRS
jgi:hypothetical protein